MEPLSILRLKQLGYAGGYFKEGSPREQQKDPPKVSKCQTVWLKGAKYSIPRQ